MKFKIGDLVLPTERCRKYWLCMFDGGSRRISYSYSLLQDPMQGRTLCYYRSRRGYQLKGSPEIFFSYELRKVKK